MVVSSVVGIHGVVTVCAIDDGACDVLDDDVAIRGVRHVHNP